MPASETPESVLRALDRTLSTGGARVTIEFAQQFPPLPDLAPRRRGGLLRPLIHAGSMAGKRAFTAGLGKLVKDLKGEGYIDFRRHRCALDYGSYALIVADDRMWSGRSGRPVATLPDETATSIEPMWLLDLVRGVTGVEAEGEELVRGGSANICGPRRYGSSGRGRSCGPPRANRSGSLRRSPSPASRALAR